LASFSLDDHSDPVGLGQNKLFQLNPDGIDWKFSENIPRDFLGQSFDQLSLFPPDELANLIRDRLVIHGLPNFVMSGEIRDIQSEVSEKILGLGPLLRRHSNLTAQLQSPDDNLVSHDPILGPVETMVNEFEPGQLSFEDLAMQIGQPELPPLITEGHPLMIDT